MTPVQSGLYERICSFDIDGGPVEQTFEARLATERGWSRSYARRVIAEYRRFLLLAVTGEGLVTPSRDVDEAWHLHLTYTRSYWERLCPQVLGRPLHHDPTMGGPAEAARFRAQYQQTLDQYRSTFEEEPPPDIWPDVDVRFAAKRRRVKPASVIRVGVVGLAGATLSIAGCSATTGWSDGEKLLFIGILALLMFVAIAYVWHRWGPGGGSSGCGGGCGGGASGCGGGGCASGCGGGGCGGGGD